MTIRGYSLFILIASLTGCGGGGGSGGSSNALFAGPLMFVGAQMRIYDDRHLQLADFNDDGFPELLYEQVGPTQQTVFMPGSETELFGPEQLPNIGILSAIADFDGDGILDIFSWVDDEARGQRGLPDFSFVRGNGDNTFSDPVPLDLAVDFGNFLVADINGDDFEDLLALGYGEAIAPIVNQGDASFVAMPSLPVNEGRTASADLNQDNFDDIIQFPFSPIGTVEVRLSLGDGTFGTVQTAVTADATMEPPVADLNGDENIDLIGYSEADGILAFLGQGDAAFSTPVVTETVPAFEAAFTRAIADFNDDSIPDLVYTAGETVARGQLADRTYLRLGRGDGAFDATPALIDDGSVEVRDLLTMDVDRDGNLDVLIVVNDDGYFLRPVFGNGDGTFRADAPVLIETADADNLLPQIEQVSERSTRPLDVDADGNLDIVVLNNFLDNIGVFYGNGDLTFEPVRRYSTNQTRPRWTVDLDVDGDVDFFGTMTLDNWYNAVRNYGGGDLAALPGMFAADNNARLSQMSDFDQDGLIDLAFDADVGDVGVMYNLGDMQFAPMTIAHTSGHEIALGRESADVTGDGYPDLVLSRLTGDQTAQLQVLPSGPGRTLGDEVLTDFSFPGTDQAATGGHELADFNGDGRADAAWLLSTINEGAVVVIKIFSGEPDGTFTETQQLFVPGVIYGARVIDLDDDSDLDLVVIATDLEDFVAGLPAEADFHVFLNSGTGEFEYAGGTSLIISILALVGGFEWDVTDVNADGYPDAVSYATSFGLGLALGEGDGTFRRPNYFRIGGGLNSSSRDNPLIGDFDNDGDADFVVRWRSGGSVQLAENRMIR